MHREYSAHFLALFCAFSLALIGAEGADSNELLESGLRYQHASEYTKAIEFYKTYIREFGDSPNIDFVVFSLADCYRQSGQPRVAIPLFKKFLEVYPKSLKRKDTYYYLGLCYFQIKDFKKSQIVFELLLDEFPKCEWVPLVNIKIREIHQVFEEEAPYRVKTAEVKPDPVPSLDDLKQKGPPPPVPPEVKNPDIKLSESAELRAISAEEAQKNREADVETYKELVIKGGGRSPNLFSPRERVESENSHLLKKPGTNPAEPEIQLFKRAISEYEKGNLHTALEFLKRHLEIHPDDPVNDFALFTMGDILLEQGAIAESIKSYELVIKFYADSRFQEDARIQVAKNHYNLGQQKRAIAYARGLLDQFPKTRFRAEAHLILGKAHRDLNNRQQALIHFDDYLKEDDIYWFFSLKNVIATERLAKMVVYFIGLYQGGDKTISKAMDAILELIKLEDYDSALTQAGQYQREFSEVESLFWIHCALLKVGQRGGQLAEALDKWVVLHPEDRRARAVYGVTLYQLEQPAEAFEQYVGYFK